MSAMPSGLLTFTICSAHCVSPAISNAVRIASSSTATGRESSHARASERPAVLILSVSAATIASSSACTATGKPTLAARFMPSRSVFASTCGKLAIPRLHMNAFNPTAPASRRPAILSRFPAVNPPHNAKSVQDFSSAIPRFSRNPAASSTGGSELNGISKNIVPPPAASAAEPVAIPSQSARPGSLKCTCASRMPGNT